MRPGEGVDPARAITWLRAASALTSRCTGPWWQTRRGVADKVETTATRLIAQYPGRYEVGATGLLVLRADE